ncbi:pancreatic lipase-related protein 3 [Drosophila innubila]|uniref:pancreatic lipase-related protein 3 n=1 Tax=Drosophila innubila TaxID=198719 RepID=UPI00148D705C|nr:pancreatic lipase-related protein 3 [Drosophila innubila]
MPTTYFEQKSSNPRNATDVLLSVNNKMRFIKVMLCLLLAAVAVNVPPAIATPAAGKESPETGPGYLLSTRRNQKTPQRIDPEVESLLRSSFYALDPVVLSIPQWRGNSSSKLTSALLERQACNVFALDLAEVETESEIVASVSSLIILLHQHFDVPLRQQQIVGFADGGHLAGAVAEQVQQLLGEKLPQITALDPLADSDKITHRLSSKDASFVEVVHTNGLGLGTMKQSGHVDFYPNGGQQQPGCESKPDPDACSHERALDLAVEMWSTANDFVSAKCASVENMSAQNCRWSSLRMGVNVQSTSGIYFLETQSQPPFGRGAYHIGFL